MNIQKTSPRSASPKGVMLAKARKGPSDTTISKTSARNFCIADANFCTRDANFCTRDANFCIADANFCTRDAELLRPKKTVVIGVEFYRTVKILYAFFL